MGQLAEARAASRRSSVARTVATTAARLAWSAGGRFWLAMIGLAALTGVIAPVAAWVLKQLIDQLTTLSPASSAGLIVGLAVAVVALNSGSLALSSLSGVTAAACQRTMSVAVAADLYAAVNRIQGLAHFERPAFQDDLRLAERAAEETPAGLTTVLAALLQGGTTIAAFAGILVAAWPPMLPLLLAACLPTALVQLVMIRRSAQTSEAMMGRYRQWFQLRGLLSEPKAVMEIRVLGLGEFFRSRLVTALREATGAEYLVKRRIAVAQGGLSLLGGVITAGGAAVVAMRAAHGQLAVGDFVLFLAAVSGVQGALIGTVNEFGSLGTALRLLRHYVAITEIGDDLAAPAGGSARPTPPLRHGVELRDVWFRYAGGDWVLRGVSATLPYGQATALVGVNGAGKSTLIKLLSRLYDPQRGAITWDGIDLRELDPAELRQRLAVTFQDFLTYDLTIAENIGIGSLLAGHDRSRVCAAAELVDLADAIGRLRNGYDTMLSSLFLGEGDQHGATLSGGQCQRLVIARTLMRDQADLMVLDEPSSGLDPQAEHLIHQRLARHRQGRTTLLVSHRLSAVRDADQILVLDAGEIAERGTHESLMTAGGQYARLFSLQAAAYQDDRLRPLTRQPG
jgi:ATP-binding cassette, subfamily B, bacterial